MRVSALFIFCFYGSFFCGGTLFASTDLIMPWLTNQPQFRATMVLSNLESEPADVVISATRPEGHSPGELSFQLQLGPFEQRVLNVEEAFSELGEGSGFATRITSESDGVTGAFVVRGTGSTSGSSPAQGNVVTRDSASPAIFYDYLTVRKDGGFTGLVVINTGEEAAEVTLSAYQNGTRLASNKTVIQPNRPFANTTEALFPGVSGDIYAVAESNQPLLGAVFLFNRFLEPSFANARPLNQVPNVPAFETTVTTQVARTAATDAIILGQDGAIYGAGGFQRDDVVKIALDGQVTTIATGLSGPVHLIQDAEGALYVSEFVGHQISKIDPQGNRTIVAEGLDAPTAMAFDAQGDLWIANYGRTFQGRTIVKRNQSGDIVTMVDDPLINGPIDIIFAENGDLFIANQNGGRILRAKPSGEVSTIAQVPTTFLGHMIFVDGVFYVTSINGHSVYKAYLDGKVEKFAGSGVSGITDGPGLQAQFVQPNGLALAAGKSSLFISQGGNTNYIRKLTLR